MRSPQDPTGTRAGDKVRVRSGANASERGVVTEVRGDLAQVRLNADRSVWVPSETLINYSLAARRAWQTMPKKAGRPRKPGPAKVAVTMRLDQSVRRDLLLAAELGLIPSQEAAVNTWLRQQLKAILDQNREAADAVPPTGGASIAEPLGNER